MLTSTRLLWLECLIVFVGLPIIVVFDIFDLHLVMIPLFVLLLPAGVWLGRRYGFNAQIFWCADKKAERSQLGVVIKRFLVFALLLVIITWLVFPQRFLNLPTSFPRFWILLILLYPVFSVYPQELLYRTFFFHRYQALFPNQQVMILANAVLFSWMHIVFNSLVAVVYTLVGGLMFAHTYQKTRSLRLVSFEHTLYGVLILTIGYAQDFLNKDLLESFGVVL